MKCRYCDTENFDNAQFCRVCGKPLERKELTLRERYPEYSFEPTSVTKVKGSSSWWILIVILGIALLISLFYTIGLLIEGGIASDTEEMAIGACCIIPDIIIGVLFKKTYQKTMALDLSSQYNYIEGRHDKTPYRFVIKDSKFGVFNVKTRKIQIPCAYEYLKWKSQDKILLATMDGTTFEIDIFGNRLK